MRGLGSGGENGLAPPGKRRHAVPVLEQDGVLRLEAVLRGWQDLVDLAANALVAGAVGDDNLVTDLESERFGLSGGEIVGRPAHQAVLAGFLHLEHDSVTGGMLVIRLLTRDDEALADVAAVLELNAV